MKLCLLTRNRQALEQLAGELEAETLRVTGDITRDEDLNSSSTPFTAHGESKSAV